MPNRSEKQKMLAGEPYLANDPELIADQYAASVWMERFNRSLTLSLAEREALLREGLA